MFACERWLARRIAVVGAIIRELQQCRTDKERELISRVKLMQRVIATNEEPLIRSMVDLFKPLTFLSGTNVYAEGDRAFEVYVVLAGTVTLTSKLSQHVYQLKVGDLFGERELLFSRHDKHTSSSHGGDLNGQLDAESSKFLRLHGQVRQHRAQVSSDDSKMTEMRYIEWAELLQLEQKWKENMGWVQEADESSSSNGGSSSATKADSENGGQKVGVIGGLGRALSSTFSISSGGGGGDAAAKRSSPLEIIREFGFEQARKDQQFIMAATTATTDSSRQQQPQQQQSAYTQLEALAQLSIEDWIQSAAVQDQEGAATVIQGAWRARAKANPPREVSWVSKKQKSGA